MSYSLDFGWLYGALGAIGRGAAMTVFLIVVTTLAGILISVLAAAGRRSGIGWLRQAIGVYVEVIRNTPFLVQIYFIFFALPFAGVRLDPTPTAIIALGINGGAYAIEIIRGGVQSIPRGQIEAGMALGLHRLQVFRLVVFKPAMRAIFPSLASQFILLSLTTSVTSAIAAYELTSVAQRIESDSFRSFEVYGAVTVLYLGMSTLLLIAFGFVARHLFHYPNK